MALYVIGGLSVVALGIAIYSLFYTNSREKAVIKDIDMYLKRGTTYGY